MAQQPWYKAGLRFECTQCGECCTGAPGFVWVNKQEIESLAGLVPVGDVDEFERKYVRKVGIRKSLVEFPNGDCVFFCAETKRCTVYEARPRQCRTWPFWDSNLRSEEAWEETCQICPGSGKGTLYQLGEVEKRRKVLRI
jgi:Fe-S-cluster containining protein